MLRRPLTAENDKERVMEQQRGEGDDAAGYTKGLGPLRWDQWDITNLGY